MDYGKVTLSQLTVLIDANINKAKELGLKISWGYKRKQQSFYARIHSNEIMRFERFYAGKFVHLLLAELHDDIAGKLNEFEQAIKRAKSVEDMNRQKERREMLEQQWKRDWTKR